MARTKKQEPSKEKVAVVTRAEKKDATKNLIKECLAVKPHKHNEIIEAVAKLYVERFGGEDADNINDVKGRVGSVLDIMKKESEIMYDGGMYALKARILPEPPVKKTTKKTEKKAEEAVEEKPAKKTVRKKKEAVEETAKEEVKEEKPVKKTAKSAKKEPLPPAPIQPIAPVAPVTPEVAPEPIPEDKPAPKKRGRKPKAKAEEPIQEAKVAEKPVETAKEVKEEVKEEPQQLVVKEKAELVKKEVMDVSFLLGEKKGVKPPVKEEKPPEKAEKKPEIKQEEKPAEKPVQKAQNTPANVRKLSDKNVRNVRKVTPKAMTADEKLCEVFLKRIRSLGGDYFEYYSVYLLERYSMKNGRRLEGLKISGGERDGGIDGEIELTDKLGFRETIYIQSKNWNPEKGDERLWVVGETLLQQFIGACAYRQAKDGKQHCRGIFITTSRFTPEAKRILETMSDKIVGYDGTDLYEAAKECSFGLIEKNGVWSLDERILSGDKAFFHLF
ncbi:MAG: restriction endonuclease [Clostridia bacterium]|nr:restriction endonuclease [Clostridia bacterium]